MEAIISGKLGSAALLENGSAEVIWMSGRTQQMSAPSAESLYRNVDDAILLRECSRSGALESLNLHWMKDRALLLTLTYLDKETPVDERVQAGDLVDSFLTHDSVSEYLKSVLYSRPLPLDETVPKNGIVSKLGLGKILELLFDNQSAITHTRATWDSATHNLSVADKDEYEKKLIDIGAFYRLTSRSKADINSLKFDCLSRLSSLPDFRSILSEFIDPHLELCDVVEPSSRQPEFDYTEAAEVQVSALPDSRSKHEKYQDVRDQLRLAESLFGDGKLEEAQRIISWAADKQVASGDQAYAAKTLCSASEFAKKISNFTLQEMYAKKAVEIAPVDSRALSSLADAYYNINDFESASTYFIRSVEHGDQGADTVFGLAGQARVQRKQYKFDDAHQLIQEALAYSEADLHAWDLSAEILRDLGRFDEAIETYDSAARKFPGSSVPICGKAAACSDAGYYGPALETYQSAIDFYPKDAVAYTGKGHLLARTGDLKSALPLLYKGIELAEDKFIAISALASAYRINGKHGRAIRVLSDQLENAAPSLLLYSQLIEAAIQSGKYSEASQWLAKAVEIFGGQPALGIQQVKLLAAMGKFEEALTYLETELALPSFRPEVVTEKSCILRRLNQIDEAVQAIEPFVHTMAENKYFYAEATLLGVIPLPEDVVVDRAGKRDIATVEDWEQDYASCIALIGSSRAKDAWRMSVDGKKRAPFRNLRRRFGLLLAVARNTIGRSGSVGNALKGSPTPAAFIVRALAFWKLGLSARVEHVLLEAQRIISPDAPAYPYIQAVAELTSHSYQSESANDEVYALEHSLLLQVA